MSEEVIVCPSCESTNVEYEDKHSRRKVKCNNCYKITDTIAFKKIFYTREELKAIRKLLDKLMIYINPITVPHRHGNKIPKRRLDQLSNLQIDIEEELRRLDEC